MFLFSKVFPKVGVWWIKKKVFKEENKSVNVIYLNIELHTKSCLSCALRSYVKRLQDGSLQLHPGFHKHFWRGTWHCWHTGPHRGERGWVFGSDSELLFARSQLLHWWLLLPCLALMQCLSAAAILQEAKRPNFLVMAVSDSVLAHVINPAHGHTTKGAIPCQ